MNVEGSRVGMKVVVDQTGHQEPATAVDLFAASRPGSAPYFAYEAVLDDDKPVLDQLGALAVKDRRVGKSYDGRFPAVRANAAIISFQASSGSRSLLERIM